MAPPRGHPRYGGRRAGSLNRHTVASREAMVAAAVKACDLPPDFTIESVARLPVEFLLRGMLNEKLDITLRGDFAKALMPYFHPRMVAAAVITKNLNGAGDGVAPDFGRLLGEIEARLGLCPPQKRVELIEHLRSGESDEAELDAPGEVILGPK